MKKNNIKIKKGLNIPIEGYPDKTLYKNANVSKVALVAGDYINLKPRMYVKVGDKVKVGQVLFQDKKNEKVLYTSPGGGEVIEINRGEKRALISVVIKINIDKEEKISFKRFERKDILNETSEEIINQLLKSGVWTSFRIRPFDKVADPDNIPNSIFVNAMDTNPFAPSMEDIINNNVDLFNLGLLILSRMARKNVFVCLSIDDNIKNLDKDIDKVKYQKFSGVHPAGLVGTHIHFLDPVGRGNHAWHIVAQDLIALANFIKSGEIDLHRVVSFAGYGVKEPCILNTRVGADVNEIARDMIKDDEMRIISGSVLYGRNAIDSQSYLGRYHQIISVIREDRRQRLLGWIGLGLDDFSFKRTVFSKLKFNKKFQMGTSLNGDLRPIVPIGSYEDVMPLDIMPTALFKALAVEDIEEAEKLGCLELSEEDLALCTFVCHSKINHMALLRNTLNIIEKEG